MSDINITVNDEIVNIDVIDEPVLVNVVNSPGQQGPAGPGVPVGGTTGQILAKASATDYDTEWINNYAKYLATNVRNQTGSTIAAFQVVYISGATGNKPLISLADADTEATSSKTYGVTATSIANNGTGDVVTAGELSGINTSAFNEGDLLWLSTTAGGVVTTPPAEPAHAVFIGYVVRSHPTLGVIDVAIANGYELNELHGVQITSAANNDGLFYNSGNGLWENKSITTALGFTPANAATTLTINGVTYDLSTSRTWTIAAGISGSGAAGQVTYWTGSSAVSGSNNLFWNNPSNRLDLNGTDSGDSIRIINRGYITFSDTANTLTSRFRGQTGSFVFQDSAFNTRALISTGAGLTYFNPTGGGVMIGTSSDLGTRLGVVGDTLLRGSGATSATTALTVQNSSSTNLFRVANDGFVYGGYVNYVGQNSTNPLTFSFVDGAFTSPGAAGRNFGYFNSNTTQTGDQYHFALSGNTITATSGTHVGIYYSRTFAPTSGSGIFSATNIAPIINQTGGANGITRGLYVNPTLTAAADFRAIETTAGNVLFGSNFFWDNTNGRLGIGTNAPLFGRLEVFGGVTNLRNANGLNILSEQARFSRSDSILNIRYHSISTTHSNVVATNEMQFLIHSAASDSSQVASLILKGNGNAQVLNNLLIGGTTDGGQRLQVYGDTLLRGSGNTNATTALTVQNSSSTNLFTVRNDGLVSVTGGNIATGVLSCTTTSAALSISMASLLAGSATGDTYFSIGRALTTNNSALIGHSTVGGGNYAFITIYGRPANDFAVMSTGQIGIGTSAPNTSARLQIDTTTQGFLPPRMTTTQKNAISTPAAGLVVYDTTLNKLCVYTTAWETITSI